MADYQGSLSAPSTQRSGRLVAWWVASLVFVVMTVWTLFQETDVRYLIYLLPLIIPVIYLVAEQGRVQLYGSGLLALMLYVVFALGSLLYNGTAGYFAYRDLLIISGYLCLFTIHVRSPPFVADLAMGTLAVGLAIEAARNGIGLDVNFLASEGIIESALAFPLGLVFLYYFHERKWARALIALVLLFLAFKRMALFAAFAAISMDFALRFIGAKGINRYAAAGFVVICSLAALYLNQIFALYAETFAREGVNANMISLGRWELASILWDHIASHGSSHTLLGFGPGASDHLIVINERAAINPHNDWLKLYFDYGIIGFIGGHVILYLIHAKNTLGLMIYVYTGILMMTTNPLVYLFYFVFVFLIIRIKLAERTPRRFFLFRWYGDVRAQSGRA